MTEETSKDPWQPVTVYQHTMEYDNGIVDVGAEPWNRSARVFCRALGRHCQLMTLAEAREIGAALIKAAEVGEQTWPESVYPPKGIEPGSEEYRRLRAAGRTQARERASKLKKAR